MICFSESHNLDLVEILRHDLIPDFTFLPSFAFLLHIILNARCTFKWKLQQLHICMHALHMESWFEQLS